MAFSCIALLIREPQYPKDVLSMCESDLLDFAVWYLGEYKKPYTVSEMSTLVLGNYNQRTGFFISILIRIPIVLLPI